MVWDIFRGYFTSQVLERPSHLGAGTPLQGCVQDTGIPSGPCLALAFAVTITSDKISVFPVYLPTSWFKGNSKSGKFNYGQTSCCSSYRASTNRLACSNTVALGFNGLLKKYISKLTILITGTFSILHGITQKACGKAVTTTQSKIHQFPGLHLNTESSSSITSLGLKLLPAGPLQKDRNMSCSSRAPKFLGFLRTVLSEQF